MLDGFLLRILKSVPISKEEAGQMSIIVRSPYSYLITDFLRVFNGQEDLRSNWTVDMARDGPKRSLFHMSAAMLTGEKQRRHR